MVNFFFIIIKKRMLKEHRVLIVKGTKRHAVYYFCGFFPLTQML
jgi:hypothetical protein